MKHLGTCTMEEFLPRAVKLRAPLLKWLSDIDAAAIYKRHQGTLPEDAEQTQVLSEFDSFVGEIEAAAMEKAPELTMEILRLITFDDGEEHTFPDYEKAAIEVYLNRDVRSFFVRSLKPSLTTSSPR